MNNKDNGGPAFPISDVMALDPRTIDEMVSLAHGMTLRDYFAAKAMQGMLACPVQVASDQYMTARDAYSVADAMLEARKQ